MFGPNRIRIRQCLFMDVWLSLKSSLIIHLNHSNRIRNEKFMAKIRKLVEIENIAFPVPRLLPRKCPECGLFYIFFSIFFHPIQLYSPYPLQNHFIFILTSLFYSNPLSLFIFFQNLSMNSSQYHSNMGCNPYTTQTPRFVRVCSKP